MKAQAAYLKYKIDTSFWFLPGLMTLGAVILSFSAVYLDRYWIGPSFYSSDWLYSAEPASARQLLVTIAGSMITVTSLVFSVTLVALTLASQQLGPRLLTSFMRDRANQVVLGVFIGTFVYALLVLGTVSSAGETVFVPYCSVVIAVVLAVASFGVLIFFFHHVAESMQADFVIAQVFNNLSASIDQYFPDRPEDESPRTGREALDDEAFRDAWQIASRETGYVQAVDVESLQSLAREFGIRIRLNCRAGHFVIRACPIADVVGGHGSRDEVETRLSSAIVIGPKRTPAQDVEYEIRALVEIAVRALSPGVNDHFTALTCVDRLGAALVRVLQRDEPDSLIRDKDGRAVIVLDSIDFAGLIDAAFHDIRQNSGAIPGVTVRLVERLTTLARFVRSDEHRAALRNQATMIGRAAGERIFEQNDREDVKARLEDFYAALDSSS